MRGFRRARWIWRALAVVALLVACAAALLTIVVHSLDRPWLKGRVRAFVRRSAGIELDYRTLRLSPFSGIEIDDLAVASPVEVRKFAPELARVGHLAATWSIRSLFGGGPAVRDVALSGVALAIVVDEHGTTSLDLVSKSESPAVPLSHRGSLFDGAPAVGKVALRGAVITTIRTEGDRVSERSELSGLSLSLSAEPLGTAHGWRLDADLGSAATPLDVELTRDREGERRLARARAWIALHASSARLDVAVDLKVVEQTFAAEVGFDDVVHVESSVHFDPSAARTNIVIHDTRLGDRTATAEASIEIPDNGDAVVRHARADVDLARVLQWVPAGLVPFTAERAVVRGTVDALSVGRAVRLSDEGAVALALELSNAKGALGGTALDVGSAALSIHARPASDGIAAQAKLEVSRARLSAGSRRMEASDLVLDLDGDESAGAGGQRADSRTELTLSGKVGSIDVRSGAIETTLDGVALRAHSLIDPSGPCAVELDAPVDHLHVVRGGMPLVDARARFTARLDDVVLDRDRLLASRAVARLGIQIGELDATLDGTKGTDSLEFALAANARSLRLARPFLPPDLRERAKWDAMSASLRTSGRMDLAADPELDEKTELVVQRPAIDALSARSVAIHLHSKGNVNHQQGELDLQAQAVAVDGTEAHDERIKLTALVDRARPSVRAEVAIEGRVAADLSVAVSYDAARHALPYEIHGHLKDVSQLRELLSGAHGFEGFDPSGFTFELSSRGALVGVVTDVTRDGTMRFEPHPSRTAAVEGKLDVRVGNLHWARKDAELKVPAAEWHGDLTFEGGRRRLVGRADIDTFHLGVRSNEVDLAGLRDESSAVVSGDLLDPDVEVSEHSTIRNVRQDVVPEYPIGNVTFSLAAERSASGLVHVSEMKLGNGKGGTTIGMTGALEIGGRRKRLSLSADVSQDLALLSTDARRFTGRGHLTMQVNVASPDLALFRTHATLKADDVIAKVPRAEIEVENASGEIPVALVVRLGEHGIELPRNEMRNPYSMLRFADQHPLYRRGGYLKIGVLKTPFVSIAPLVGALEIDQNVISLGQFEMGVRGGSITGQSALAWDGPQSTLELHVRATGLRSSHGEPFDGNIAVAIAAGDRTVVGRAEILRIGPRHLEDLLDLEDPMHVDAAMNRIRTALLFGYPDKLRLVFDRGFASARLELGGLASLVSIDELRGIPMGPVVDGLLARFLEPKENP